MDILLKHIEALNNKEAYIDIFKIIVNNKIPYTVNNNGVFFLLNNVEPQHVKQIVDIVEAHQTT